REPPESLDDLRGLVRRTVICPGQEGVAAGIARVQIRRAQQRFDGFVILAEGIQRQSQDNGHGRRIRVALRAPPENLDRWFQGLVNQKFAAPVKDIVFTRLHVRRDLQFIGGSHKFAVFFFHLTQKIVEFGRVLPFDKVLDQLASITKAPRGEVGKRQIVAVVIRGWINPLRALEKRNGLWDLVGADVELSEVVAGLIFPRRQRGRLFELLLRQGKLVQA